MKSGIHKNVVIVASFTGVSGMKKTPYYGIEFENEEGESLEFVAYLTDNTKERQLQTLIDIGFIGSKIADLSDPKKSIKDLFGPTSEPISLTVETETYQNSEGEDKEKQVIKWVNVGSKGGVSKSDYATAQAVFKGMSFDGDLMNLKKGVKKTALKKTDPLPDGFAADDLPF